MSWNFLNEWKSSVPKNGNLGRRVWLEIKYTSAETNKTADISEDVSRYFISLSYSESMSGEADDLTITLEDSDGLWLEHWIPDEDEEGGVFEVTVHTLNQTNLQEGEVTHYLGKFAMDEIELEGMPSVVKIKTASITGDSSLRSERKNNTWEDVTIKKIAEDIAAKNNLTLFWSCDENPEIDHIEQASQSDTEFLLKLCKSYGLNLKVTPEKLIIFDEAKYEEQESQITIYRPGTQITEAGNNVIISELLSYNFRRKTRDTYSKCEVKNQNGRKKEVVQGEFSDPNVAEGKGRTLYINHQVKDKTEADRLSKKKLREANKEKTTGRISTVGNFNLSAGVNLDMRNFGKLSGKYIIDKISHSISSNDCKTDVEIRKCLNGY